MSTTARIFYWGMLISFLGSLPPGMMNIVAVQIAGQQGNDAAMLYATGSMLAEIFVVRIALALMTRLAKRKRFFEVLEWITVIFLSLFSVGCFIAAGSIQQTGIAIPIFTIPAFFIGVIISLVNPMHIPFWLGWSSFLYNKGILSKTRRQSYTYITGIATGTMAGFTVFIYGGQYVLDLLTANSTVFNYVVGSMLLLLSLMQARKILLVPVQVRHKHLLRNQ